MESCCVCFGKPVIINSGITICDNCVCDHYPLTAKVINNFVMDFFQYPPPVFTIEKLLKSFNKIAYMNQFDKIELDNPHKLFNEKCILNIDEFKVFVSKCINLDCDDIECNRLIHIACARCELEMVKCLVECGDDINDTNMWGISPINVACRCGDDALELIKYLIANGADINHRDNYGQCSIHYACKGYGEASELVKYLIECGADVNCADNHGYRPIHLACEYRYKSLKLVNLLIEHNADINCANGNGLYPIHLACNIKSLKLVRCFVSNGANINCANIWGRRPIHYACDACDDYDGEMEIVKYLIECGADVNCADDDNMRPIHFARMGDHNSLELVNYLLANGSLP